MQLLYGNDGINYHTIAKSMEMTPEQEKELLHGYLGYDFAADPAKYSSVSDEPVALSYVTTNLLHTLPKEMILLSRNARMSNYQTPSYYSHFHFIEMSEDFYGEKFFDLLQYSFIKDIELNDYLAKDIDSFAQGREEGVPPLGKDAIEKEKLIPIVASIMSVVDSMSKQVRLVLDVEGDGYNQRALQVIAAIYTYLPYNIRKKAGFSTYAGLGSNGSSRVKLQLYTRDVLGKIANDVIDLANVNSREILGRIPENIVGFVTELVEKSEAEREKTFASFRLAFRLDTVTLDDHIDFYKYIKLWRTGSLEKKCDEFAKYAYVEMQKDENASVFRVFRSVLSMRFEDEHFDKRYQELIRGMLAGQKTFDFENKLKAYIMLGEALDCLQFDTQMFLDWEQGVIIAEAEQQYEDMDLYNFLAGQMKRIHGISIGRQKFKEILTTMAQLLGMRLNNLKEEIEGRIKEEEQSIILYFEGYNLSSLRFEDMDECFQKIRYKKNKAVFSRELNLKCRRYLESIPYFKSYGKYGSWRQFVEACREYLDTEELQPLAGLVEQKGEKVKILEKYRVISWQDKKDILSVYQNFNRINAISENYGDIIIPDYRLIIKESEYHLNGKEVEILAENLLCPGSGSEKGFGDIIGKKPDMIKNLLDIKAFGEGHFRLLMRISGEEEKKQILEYYLEEDILLPKEEIECSLGYADKYMLCLLAGGNVRNNILGLVLKEKTGSKDIKNYSGYMEEEENIPEDGEDILEDLGEDIQKDENIQEGEKGENVRKNREKRQYAFKYKKSKNISVPDVVLISILLPILFFVAEVLFKTRISQSIMIPCVLTGAGILFFAISLGVEYIIGHMNSSCLGGMIGSIISICAAWAAWLIF